MTILGGNVTYARREHVANPPRRKDEPPTARRDFCLHNALRRAMKHARPMLGWLRRSSSADVIETLAEIRNAEASFAEDGPE